MLRYAFACCALLIASSAHAVATATIQLSNFSSNLQANPEGVPVLLTREFDYTLSVADQGLVHTPFPDPGFAGPFYGPTSITILTSCELPNNCHGQGGGIALNGFEIGVANLYTIVTGSGNPDIEYALPDILLRTQQDSQAESLTTSGHAIASARCTVSDAFVCNALRTTTFEIHQDAVALTGTLVPVPEPPTLALLIFGLLFAPIARRAAFAPGAALWSAAAQCRARRQTSSQK